MAILILGNPQDAEAAHVADALRERNEKVGFLDSRRFPAEQQIDLDPCRNAGSIALPDGRRFRFDEISSVYWRSYDGVAAVDLPNPDQADLARNDARSLFESLLLGLPARWVNSFQAVRLHQTKPVQLRRVADLDLAGAVGIPETLVTNDRDRAGEFATRLGTLIFKPVQGGAFTRRITADQLTTAMFDSLRYAPVTLQEEIDGVDVRVYVAGDRLHACEVQTDALDFRDDPDPPIVPTQLPSAVADACRQIAAALQLVWTGIDLRRTIEGNYYFFEANPSPMFLGFQQRSGLPLTDALVSLLV